MKSILRPRSFGMLILALILAASVYGFAAANTVPESFAGDGSGDISGYTISNIVYDLNNSDPSTIDGVDFTLSAAATDVHITLNGGSWTNCTVTGGTSVSCTISLSVSAANSLRVVATN